MAIIEMTFNSSTLNRRTTVNVVLPGDKYYKKFEDFEDKPLKTLYLLHGVSGNYRDWNDNTRIQRWAAERNLCVVMPSGDNNYYIDYPCAEYGKFIGEELVEVTRRFFHLSRKREDTFIGGFSMGGFGTLRNGLKYADTFSHVVCLSGANGFFDVNFKSKYDDYFARNINELRQTDANPDVCLAELMEKKKNNPDYVLPKFYIACGTEDGGIASCQEYEQKLKDLGFEVTSFYGPGKHDWFFWDPQIKKVLDEFLPLDPKQ